jgi:predicted ATPase
MESSPSLVIVEQPELHFTPLPPWKSGELIAATLKSLKNDI